MDSKVISTMEDSNVQGLAGRMRLQKHSGTSINQLITPHKMSPTGSELPLYDTRSYKKNWMEIERSHLQAYEYLCHLSEAKGWIETNLKQQIDDIDLDGYTLQNGILLAKLARKFHPTSVKKIHTQKQLSFKHSDNIHFFLEACRNIGLPQVFLFELTDLYSRKNIPKVIYCIHALSHLLYKKGLATNIQDLVGYLDFTDDQLQTTKRELDINGYNFPAFLNVSYDLSRAMEGTASLKIKSKNNTIKNNLKNKFNNNNNSVKNKSIKVIHSHTATLSTNSAINLVKNGFKEVEFKPELSLPKDHKSVKNVWNKSMRSTLNSSPLQSSLTSSFNYGSSSLNSSIKNSQSNLTHVTYNNPKLKNSPKLSTASYRVVGKRKSKKFIMRLDNLNNNSSNEDSIKLKDSKDSKDSNSINRLGSKSENSFVTAKESQSIQSINHFNSIFSNFNHKQIPSNSSNNEIKADSILKRIQNFKKDSNIIHRQKYKGKLIRDNIKRNLLDKNNKNNEKLDSNGLQSSISALDSSKEDTQPLKDKIIHKQSIKDLNASESDTTNNFESSTSSSLLKKNTTDSSVNKPIKDLHKMYGIKTLPNKNKQSKQGSVKISKMNFATTQTVNINIKSTQTSNHSNLDIKGSNSLSSKFAKLINSIDNKKHSTRKTILSKDYKQKEEIKVIAKEKLVEISYDVLERPTDSFDLPMLKMDSELTESPKTEEEILELEMEEKDSIMDSNDSSLIHSLSQPILNEDNKVKEINNLVHYSLSEEDTKINDSFDEIDEIDEIPFEWERYEPFIVMAQSYVRGIQQRKAYRMIQNQLHQYIKSIIIIQANCRGCLTRLYTMEPIYQIRTIRECIDLDLVRKVQAVARKLLTRHQFLPKLLEARSKAEGFFNHLYKFQALARRILIQRKWTYTLSNLHNYSNQVIDLQANIRGFLVRQYYRQCFDMDNNIINNDVSYINHHQHYIVDNPLISPSQQNIQQYNNLMRFQNHYLKNRAYIHPIINTHPDALELNSEADLSNMQTFLPLLEDSDKDFSEELELEGLRKISIKKIRDIIYQESQLNELDIKIALLVRNRISLQEVLRISKMSGLLGNSTNSNSNLLEFESKENNLISLKKLDKVNRKRLEGYQQMFYLLQTQPIYLAKLLSFINQNHTKFNNDENNLLSNEYKKFFETVVLSLFGFGQNKREEFMLLNLFKTAIHIELDSINRIEDFLRGNPVFIKLAVHYNRGLKERKYLRELLQPIIVGILNDPEIDLQTNPLLIYRALIKQEELKTGKKSMREYDVTAEVALNDSETRSVLIQHLQQLRSITDQFIERIYNSLDNMPYGIRFIAKELKQSLLKKFPNEKQNVMIKIVGHLVYYRYINPAIIAPESFDVIEREISPHHRRCLAEVAKMLNQVSMGKLFNEDNIFLQPLNTYVAYTSEKFSKYIYSVTEVENPETYFEIDEFLDLTFTKRPIIYISPNEIYSLHKMLNNNLEWLVNNEDDPLATILNEIGDPPIIPADQIQANSKEICLHLSNRFPSINELDCELKHLFVETKRLMTYILRVQSGSSLLEILQKPIGPNEENRFQEILLKEKKEPNQLNDHKLIDVKNMTFAQLKQTAFNNALKLEVEGELSRQDNYQKMIHSIAMDIRSKSKRRIERKHELKRIYQTIQNLKLKERYLFDQLDIYKDYLGSCMNMHNTNKMKNKTIPFTKQYFHLKEVARNGSVPQFGSFKYSALRLYQKGILISINDYEPKQFYKIYFIISSDSIGIFNVLAFYMNTKFPCNDTQISLEELLQAQFDNQFTLDLLDGDVKLNVNLLLHFINKKFYV